MQQRVCDRCKAPVGRERQRVTREWIKDNGERRHEGIDLCPVCADMLTDFLSGKAVPAAKEAKRP